MVSALGQAVESRGDRRFHHGTEDHTNKDEDFYSNVEPFASYERGTKLPYNLFTAHLIFGFFTNARQVFTQRVNLWRDSEEARHLLHLAAPIIGRIACALEGIKGVRVWHDQAL